MSVWRDGEMVSAPVPETWHGRPVLGDAEAVELAPTRWTRANLKEILPELPSPLALSYLAAAMNRMFTAYHSALGYVVPTDVGQHVQRGQHASAV